MFGDFNINFDEYDQFASPGRYNKDYMFDYNCNVFTTPTKHDPLYDFDLGAIDPNVIPSSEFNISYENYNKNYDENTPVNFIPDTYNQNNDTTSYKHLTAEREKRKIKLRPFMSIDTIETTVQILNGHNLGRPTL